MATTGFWPVKGQLKKVLDYADNPEKTASDSAGNDLEQALSYAAVCTLTIALDALSAGSQGLPVSRWGWQAGMFLFLPFLQLYTRDEVRTGKGSRWFFYLYYPAHMLVLYVVSKAL